MVRVNNWEEFCKTGELFPRPKRVVQVEIIIRGLLVGLAPHTTDTRSANNLVMDLLKRLCYPVW